MPIDERRRDDITAAVAAHIATHQKPWLKPNATRLLIVMFADADVCRRNLDSLVAEGFSRRNLVRLLLRALVEAGLVSKERGVGRAPSTYRLHLPPRKQP
jgi:hypothetical protein